MIANPSPNELRTEHSRIRFPEGFQDLAKKVGESFEFARSKVGEHFGYPDSTTEIFLHATPEQMYAGLRVHSPFSPAVARVLAFRVGISPASRATLHILCKSGNKEPWLWHMVTDEYCDGRLDDLYGPALVADARWFYEGIGAYEAHRALRTSFPQSETRWSRASFKVTAKALLRGKLLSFTELLSEGNWMRNIEQSDYVWYLQYAQAYAFVAYLVNHHGIDELKQVLSLLTSGLPLGNAMEEALGKRYGRLLFGFKAFLIRYALSLTWPRVRHAVRRRSSR